MVRDWHWRVRLALAARAHHLTEPQLDTLIKDESALVRKAFAEKAGKDILTTRQLITLLRDKSEDVRQAAQKSAKERVFMVPARSLKTAQTSPPPLQQPRSRK